MVWIEYVVCAIFILMSGSLLSRYGDMLAEKTGMGRAWIGLILLATVTSLPELATGLSSVTIADAPEIAAGTILGSCVLNLAIIAFLDLFYRPGPILSRVDQGQILSAGMGVVLIGITVWGLLIGMLDTFSLGLWIGPSTLPTLIFYFVAVKMVFQFERKRMDGLNNDKEESPSDYQSVSLQKVYLSVCFHAVVIIGAGIWLSFIGGRIAEATGWGTTFVGSLFIAVSTSFPEIVTTFAALRLGAPDLAIANLLGSNIFNIAILAIDDLAYTKGPLLSEVSSNHLLSAITAIMMTGIVIVGLVFRGQKKTWSIFTWTSVALFLLYLLNTYLLFALRNGGV